MRRRGGSLKVDVQSMVESLEDTLDGMDAVVRRGVEDVLDDWRREAVDVAPIDRGVLRRNIRTEPVRNVGGSIMGELSANAVEQSPGRRFNYAYYIHEGYMSRDGKRLRTPGTVEKFIEKPAEQNEARWFRQIESDIKAEIKRKGWG